MRTHVQQEKIQISSDSSLKLAYFCHLKKFLFFRNGRYFGWRTGLLLKILIVGQPKILISCQFDDKVCISFYYQNKPNFQNQYKSTDQQFGEKTL